MRSSLHLDSFNRSIRLLTVVMVVAKGDGLRVEAGFQDGRQFFKIIKT